MDTAPDPETKLRGEKEMLEQHCNSPFVPPAASWTLRLTSPLNPFNAVMETFNAVMRPWLIWGDAGVTSIAKSGAVPPLSAPANVATTAAQFSAGLRVKDPV